MSIKSRIDKLSRAAPPARPGVCRCAGPVRLRLTWPDGEPVTPFCEGEPTPERPPDLCARCGRPIEVVDLVWADGLEVTSEHQG